MDSQQLSMNFNESNPFKDALSSGKFSLIIELAPPPEGQGDSDTLFTLEKIAEECSRHQELVGLSISDRLMGSNCIPPWKLAEKLSKISGKPTIAHLSGAGHDLDSLHEDIVSSHSSGVNNILFVSGNLNDQYDQYLESTEAIRLCNEKYPNLATGAAVNPFKYSVNSSFAQYLKMIQKINSGAEFIVTQAGLDMRKYDEVLRFCTHREITVPIIARLSLLSHDLLPDITALELEPGVPLSREIASLILREANEAQDQSSFMNNQLRRLCLQINACALMGYNGVQIKGIKNAVELNQVLTRMRACMEEISNLDQFYHEWNNINQSVVFSPGSTTQASLPKEKERAASKCKQGTYYIYKNSDLRPVDESIPAQDTDDLEFADFAYPSDFEVFRTKLAKKLQLNEKHSAISNILKRTLTGINGDVREDLAKTQFSDLSNCPKQLIHGSCGGTTTTDLCENGKTQCPHLDRIGMAASLNQLDLLEQPSD